MLRVCSADGCTILTLGELCSLHEPEPERREWPRGRPFRTLGGQAGQLDLAHVEAERLGHPDPVFELAP
jgi:hypothetical protein